MKILIKNADYFNGRTDELQKGFRIIVDGNLVTEITRDEVSEEQFDRVLDAKDYTVIPGLVDNHVHTAMHLGNGARFDETIVHGVSNAKRFLYNGFTTVRDAGGVTYGIKKAIDDGVIEGPRIFPSNAFITQTCGHGDFRENRGEVRLADGVYSSPILRSGESYVADGAAEVLKGVREQLFLGSSQIKIMAGGGASSDYDPILTTQFTLEEMQAAVNAASDYGTYVMAHLYTKDSMMRAARAGVKSFEHAAELDDELSKVIVDQGIFICVCPNPSKKKSGPLPFFAKRPRKPGAERIDEGRKHQHEFILKYDLKLLFGTDYMETIVGGMEDAQRKDWFSFEERFGSFRSLLSATGNANDLIKLTTYQNPYPGGKIGVLEEGAFADILFVKGNPLEQVSVLAETDNIKLIMKDGKIYKDEL